MVAGNRAFDGFPALLDYSLTGVLQQEILVPPPPGIESFTLRDVGVDRFGRIHVVARHKGFNGNLTLCTYDGTGWSHLTVPDWSQAGVTYYGGMGVNDDYLFYPDQSFGADETEGIVRFSLDNLSDVTHFPTGRMHSVTLGLNGLLYATERYGSCRVYHPGSMQQVADLGDFVLFRGSSVVDLCVGPAGDIFTVDLGDDVSHFDAFGGFQSKLEDVGPCGDIEVREDGTLIIGLANQNVLVGTTALQGFTRFATNPVNDPAAWIRNHLAFAPVASLPSPIPPRAMVTGIEVSPAEIALRFRRSPGVRYTLWSSGGLDHWTELPTEDSDSGVEASFRLGPRGATVREFFKIESQYPVP